jgi:excisionase family DNA binding protein
MEKMYTVREVEELMHVSRWTVYRWVDDKELEGKYLPGSRLLRITGSSLERMMKGGAPRGPRGGRRARVLRNGAPKPKTPSKPKA